MSVRKTAKSTVSSKRNIAQTKKTTQVSRNIAQTKKTTQVSRNIAQTSNNIDPINIPAGNVDVAILRSGLIRISSHSNQFTINRDVDVNQYVVFTVNQNHNVTLSYYSSDSDRWIQSITDTDISYIDIYAPYENPSLNSPLLKLWIKNENNVMISSLTSLRIQIIGDAKLKLMQLNNAPLVTLDAKGNPMNNSLDALFSSVKVGVTMPSRNYNTNIISSNDEFLLPCISTRGFLRESKWQNNRKQGEFNLFPQLYPNTLPDDLIIYVHGYNKTHEEATREFHVLRKKLVDLNYTSIDATLLYSWDSDTRRKGKKERHDYQHAVTHAFNNALSLAKFIHHFRTRYPRTNLHLFGHSLGSAVIFGALRILDQSDISATVDTIHLFGAAVPAKFLETNTGQYGEHVINHVTGGMYNYYFPGDAVLILSDVVIGTDPTLGQVGYDENMVDGRLKPKYRNIPVVNIVTGLHEGSALNPKDNTRANHQFVYYIQHYLGLHPL